jgi:hypothetical protein
MLRILDDNIKMNHTEISCETGTWLDLAQDPVRMKGLVRLYSRNLFPASILYDFKRKEKEVCLKCNALENIEETKLTGGLPCCLGS